MKKIVFVAMALVLAACSRSDTQQVRQELKTSGEELKKELKTSGEQLKKDAVKAGDEARREAEKLKRDLNKDRKDTASKDTDR